MVTTNSQAQSKRVAIIGGGWCGLYALKTTLSDGHQAIMFEKDDDIGGVWRYQEDIPGGVWRNVYAASSKTYLHASDFPMPDHYPLFPHHTHIIEYLRLYADHFDLWSHICLNHQIEQIKKKDSEWLVNVIHKNEQKHMVFDAVIICTGQAQVPSYPDEGMYEAFTGATMHSHDYKCPTEAMRDKNVLVIGSGDSAADIATEVCSISDCVYMSVRTGQWFMDRHSGARLPLDWRYSKKVFFFMGNYGNTLIAKLFELISAINFGYGGHGIDEWRPTVPILNGTITKNRDLLNKITFGKVVPRRGITHIQGRQVWFEQCETPGNIDMIIFATGYRKSIPFLPKSHQIPAYKLVFYPVDPTLAFVGTARPVFGSIPALAELQARWVSAVLSGRCQLPASDAMLQQITKDRIRQNRLFPADSHRLPNLVSHFEYADFILQQLNAKINLFHLFFTDNKKWRVLFNVPWTAFETLLTDHEKRNEAYINLHQVYNLKKSASYPSLFKFMIFVLSSAILTGLFLIYLFIHGLLLLIQSL